MLRPARTQRFVSCSLLAAALAACSSPTDHPQADSAAAPAAAGGEKKQDAGAQPSPTQAAHTQELIQQKQQLLIKTSLDNAKALQEQGKYEEARDQLAQVIQLDPSNTQALTA